MSIGIVKVGETAAIAKGIGNPVLIVGASTGRDGYMGNFASEEISEESEAKRQVYRLEIHLPKNYYLKPVSKHFKQVQSLECRIWERLESPVHPVK